MNFKSIRKISLFLWLSVQMFTIYAQITPNINSGNPAFPFPQFLDYGPERKTLASVNAPGVTHAEMEQRIKDAYRMICNNVTLTNEVVDGVPYGRPNPPNPCNCIEADGYYLLAAAYMGDRQTFNSIYMWTHDRSFNGVQRFIDGQYNVPNYLYSKGLSGAGKMSSPVGTLGESTGEGRNSATDGDVDVALALLLAYKQWGDNSGVTLSKLGNKKLSYKEEALNYIIAMVDTVPFTLSSRTDDYVMGDIGLDGYVKGGDTWKELTTKASNGLFGFYPAQGFEGRAAQHIDYVAPAWFRQFRIFLEQENPLPWPILQYKRGEASSDWLMGEMYKKSPTTIPVAGWVNDSLGGFQFTNFLDGEDFRTGWRTVMNYVWHGDPTYTWDPNTVSVIDGRSNSFEKQIGNRFAQFLKNQQGDPWKNSCTDFGTIDLTFKGISTVPYYTTPDGKPLTTFPLNLIQGAGSPSAVASQDFDLMGEIFRQCVIKWEGRDMGQKYLESKPVYFHEWFKMLGLLVLSGNYHAPDKLIPAPNLKVYLKVDKTYGFTNDMFKYTITYRNYGSLSAKNTKIKFKIPAGFNIVNAPGGKVVGDSVEWIIADGKNGTVGFQTGNLASTIDSVQIILKAGSTASGRYCTNAHISCSNGYGWVSNEYPNNITAVMERNCVDITKRALKITKTANKTAVQYSKDVTYKLKFENLSEAGWINGGRPRVNVAVAHRTYTTDPKAAQEIVLQARIYNDAIEPYINYSNYRFSYYLNEPSISCINGINGCTGGWNVSNTTNEGGTPTFLHENIVPGSSANGKWNQRVIFRFGDQFATTTQHLINQRGNTVEIHEGALAPMRTIFQLLIGGGKFDWTDDWSWDADAHGDDGGLYFPVGDDYTDPTNLGKPVTTWHSSACETAPKILKNILVEEWDGYTWRRILGNGPVPGRDLENVVIKDTLPAGMIVKAFIRDTPLATKSSAPGPNGTTILTWTIPKLLINQKDSIIYQVQVNGTCPGIDAEIENKAWISSPTESPIFSAVKILTSCNTIATCPEATTITKTSDKLKYEKGDKITFKIDYTQTTGSIADADLKNANDWTAKIGDKSSATFSNGTIAIPQIDNGDLVLTHDYSYGKNTLGEGIEGTIKAQEDQNTVIALRHDGVLAYGGVFVVIKPSATTEITVLSGKDVKGLVKLSITNRDALDFKIQVKDDKLDFWIGTSPANFLATPVLSVTGIIESTGYFGIARGTTFGNTSGTSTLLRWKTHLDAAFNVTITDVLPKTIINPINIIPAGTVSGQNITWTIGSGKIPLAKGATANLSFDATYDTCGKVTNIAYVNALGLENNQYGMCYDVNCGSAPSCTPPTVLLITGDSVLSSGRSVTLRAVVSPPATGSIFNWYKLPNTTTPLIGSGLDATSLVVSDTGRYVLRVLSATDPTCFKDSKIKAVRSGCLKPKSEINPKNPTYCSAATGVTLSAVDAGNGAIYQWLKNETPLGNPSSTNTLTNASEGVYKVKVILNGCDSISVAVTVTKSTTGSLFISGDSTICIEDKLILTTNMSSDITWVLPDGTSVQKATLELDKAKQGIYRAKYASTAGCSAEDSIEVIVRPAPKLSITPSSKTYCIGGSGVKLLATTSMPNTDFQWFKEDVPFGIATTNPVLENAKTGFYRVKGTVDGCSSESDTITIKEVTKLIPQFTLLPSVRDTCVNSQVTFQSIFSNGTIEWFEDNVSKSTAPSYSFLLTKTTEIKAIFASSESCADPKIVTEQDTIYAAPPVSPTVSIKSFPTVGACEGDRITFSIDQVSNEGASPSYQWFVNGEPQSGQTDPASFILSNWTNGSQVELQLTRKGGCIANGQNAVKSAPINLTGTIKTPIDVKLSFPGNSSSIEVCRNTQTLLAATTNLSGLTYTWTKGTTVVDQDSILETSVQEEAIYQVKAVAKGCYVGDTVDIQTITIKPADSVIAQFKNYERQSFPLVVCTGQSPALEVITKGSISSYKILVEDQLYKEFNTPNPTSPLYFEVNPFPASRRVKFIANPSTPCPYHRLRDSVVVVVMDKPKHGFNTGQGPIYHCIGQDTILTATETNASYTYRWSRSNVPLTETTPSITVKGTASYQLAISNGGCNDTTSTQVIEEVPTVKISAEPPYFQQGTPVMLKANTSTERVKSYTWSPTEIMDNPHTVTTQAMLPAPSFVKVKIITHEGCTAVDSLEIKNRNILFIPNALTPGTDDHNSFWGIKGGELFPEMEIKVFNRWGNLVFEQKGYAKPWDGSYNDKPLPTGTYYYVIKDVAFEKPLVGDVTVVR